MAHRQVLALPRRGRRFPLVPVAIGLIVVAGVAVGAVLAIGILDSGGEGETTSVAVLPTHTSVPPTINLTQVTTAPLAAVAAVEQPTSTPEPTLTNTPTFTPTPTPTLRPTPTFTPRPMSTPRPRPTATTAPQVSPNSFTFGSHKDDVLRIQGTPTQVNRYDAIGFYKWQYGSSQVTFDASTDRVTEWDNYGGNLRVGSTPGPNVTESTSFTFGSHKDDVLRIQGTPTQVNRYDAIGFYKWQYGSSQVTFDASTDRVTEWDNYGGNLRVGSTPGPNVTESTSFTFGSHKDDVLRIQGTPTQVNRYDAIGFYKWQYGSSQVTFDASTDRVTEWDNYGGNLRVRVSGS